MKFSHAPAYGFGRAPKCTLEKNDILYTPGPGNYQPNLKHKRKDPQWVFGTGKRGGGTKNDTPGAGQYNIGGAFPTGPKYSMATKAGAFDPTKTSFAPGPGK
ncbi:MAG: hypothetical protein MJ252_15500 [archaeon]|nr:hypothetical protein [archaeon]